MSASQPIPDTTEPLRGVKHVKPPIRPKPVLAPRPKDIPGSENKSPLLSPSPCSPTLDIPSAVKISQLTGPQPYGTRRTSLKRWSSSVGEEANQETNPLSPVENRSPDVPTKTVAPPVSAKPLQTGAVWKGKSPFMLTTRGWGSRDHSESEAPSQKLGSGTVSKDADPQRKETTAVEEHTLSTSKTYNRITLEHKAATLKVHDSIAGPEKTLSRVSEDVETASSGGTERIDESQEQGSSPRPSGPHCEGTKQASLSDHKEGITALSLGARTQENVPSVPVRESLHVAKSHMRDEHVNSAGVHHNQLPDGGSGHRLLSDDTTTVQGHVEAHVDLHDHQIIGDVKNKHYTQDTNTTHEQPKDTNMTAGPPKPKERKKPPVQFTLPKEEDQAEGQRSRDYTLPGSERPETKELSHQDDGHADTRSQHGERGLEEIPATHGQHKKNEGGAEEKESVRTDEPMGYVRTPMAGYTTSAEDTIYREDNISRAPTDYTKTHKHEHHDLSRQEHLNVGQADVHGSTSRHEEIKLTDDVSSFTDTTKLYKNVSERTIQDIDTKQHDGVDEDHRSVHARQPTVDPAVKNVAYKPHHFTHTSEESSALRSDDDSSAPHVSSAPYIHHYRATEDHSGIHEPTDRKEVANMSVPSEDRPPSQEIYTHTEQSHPSTAPSQPREDLTQLKDQEAKNSKSELGNFEDLESSKSKEFHSGDPTCRVIESTELGDGSDHKEAIEYYNIYSQNVPDIERPQHGDYESEDHQQSRSQLEEPLYKHAQSEVMDHKYGPSEELVHEHAPSEELVHKFAQSEEQHGSYAPSDELVHKYAPSKESVHPHAPSEELVHKFAQSEEQHGSYAPSDELAHKYAETEELVHEYAPSKESVHTHAPSEGQIHTYTPSEEPDNKYVPSKEPRYTYATSEELVHIDAAPDKLVHTYKQPEEPDHHSEEESHRYTYEQPEESALHNVQSEQLAYKLSRAPTLPYEELDRPITTYDQLMDSHLPDTPPKEAEEHEHAEETLVKYTQPEDPPQKITPHVPQISEELYYQQTPAEKPDHQYGQLEELHSHHQHSTEPEDEPAPSEELDVRYTHPGIHQDKHESPEDSHLRKYYSEKESVQTPEEKIRMSEESDHRWTQSTEREGYMDLHATETQSGHVSSIEQDKAEKRPEKNWEQQYTESPPEEDHHKDDVPSEAYHKDEREQEAQQEDPKTLGTHTVKPEHRDLPTHTGYEVTDGHLQSRESPSEASRGPQAEDTLGKHTEKGINGHPEHEELENGEDRPDGPKVSEETHGESPGETVSETEEAPEEINFDFLESRDPQ
ncbi:182 kDa tankyrase-1-binding protein isoform 2-T2 [Leptodactylus fuscus]